MHLKLQTKDIALIAVYAALYAALVNALPGLSFGPLNLRIADSMIAAVPLLGIGGVLGHTLGVFIGNILLWHSCFTTFTSAQKTTTLC
jgi:uncharacterized membrane protein